MFHTIQRESSQLTRGKNFHEKLQDELIQTAEGDLSIERTVVRKNEEKAGLTSIWRIRTWSQLLKSNTRMGTVWYCPN